MTDEDLSKVPHSFDEWIKTADLDANRFGEPVCSINDMEKAYKAGYNECEYRICKKRLDELRALQAWNMIDLGTKSGLSQID